jgi:hypothetical protein
MRSVEGSQPIGAGFVFYVAHACDRARARNLMANAQALRTAGQKVHKKEKLYEMGGVMEGAGFISGTKKKPSPAGTAKNPSASRLLMPACSLLGFSPF